MKWNWTNTVNHKRMLCSRSLHFFALCLGLMSASPAFADLKVFEKNPNYLTYKGAPIFLVCARNTNHRFHVLDFDLNYLDECKSYGVNHVFLLLECAIEQRWSFAQNPSKTYWNKLQAIVQKAYENDIIVGICMYTFAIYAKPAYSSFNLQCQGECDNEPGPLNRGQGFFDVYSQEPAVVSARMAQQKIMTGLVEATWEYPNVYYTPMWEIRVVWNDQTEDWLRWMSNFMEDEGKKIVPNMKHLFAIEKTLTAAEAKDLNMDFVFDEDGNAYKKPGIPFVYWSTDGVFRGWHPCWNNHKCDEPDWELNFLRQTLIDTAAGTAAVWEADSIEQEYMTRLSAFVATIENWCDEPGQEITDATVPLVEGGLGVDVPGSPDCYDVDIFPPTIEGVYTPGENQVQVLYSECVDPVTATNKSNYHINPAIAVHSVIILEDQKSVILNTDRHNRNVTYTLTVNNVKDKAYYPNTILPNTQKQYMYKIKLVLYNLTPAYYDTAHVQLGKTYYIDRQYLVNAIPADLSNLTWIKTANSDKASTGDSFFKFYTTAPNIIYVGYDITITSLPAWLQTWQNTTLKIKTEDTDYRIYKREFSAGQVVLGGNYGGTNGSMYIVLAKKNEDNDTIPPAPPTGLTIEKVDTP